jgi:hypothetical protein
MLRQTRKIVVSSPPPLEHGLEHSRQPFGLVMEMVLRLGAPCAEDATGCTQRGAKPLGELPKRLAIPDGPSVGHTIEIL